MSTPTAATSVAKSPLFRFPAELRLTVYEYALYGDEDGICEVTREHGIPEPALLLTCKIIRGEALAVFSTVNVFRTLTESCHPAVIAMMQRKLAGFGATGVKVDGLRVQSGFVGPPSFTNLVLWLKHAHSGGPSVTGISDSAVDGTKAPVHKFLEGLFGVAADMRGCPWTAVEKVINDLRGGSIALQEDWKDDA
jgi:hypothetical protein